MATVLLIVDSGWWRFPTTCRATHIFPQSHPGRGTSQHPLFPCTTQLRRSPQDPVNWHLKNLRHFFLGGFVTRVFPNLPITHEHRHTEIALSARTARFLASTPRPYGESQPGHAPRARCPQALHLANRPRPLPPRLRPPRRARLHDATRLTPRPRARRRRLARRLSCLQRRGHEAEGAGVRGRERGGGDEHQRVCAVEG